MSSIIDVIDGQFPTKQVDHPCAYDAPWFMQALGCVYVCQGSVEIKQSHPREIITSGDHKSISSSSLIPDPSHHVAN